MASEGRCSPSTRRRAASLIEAEWAGAGQCAGMHSRVGHTAPYRACNDPEAKQDSGSPTGAAVRKRQRR